jgi:hypothetical protein
VSVSTSGSGSRSHHRFSHALSLSLSLLSHAILPYSRVAVSRKKAVCWVRLAQIPYRPTVDMYSVEWYMTLCSTKLLSVHSFSAIRHTATCNGLLMTNRHPSMPIHELHIPSMPHPCPSGGSQMFHHSARYSLPCLVEACVHADVRACGRTNTRAHARIHIQLPRCACSM